MGVVQPVTSQARFGRVKVAANFGLSQPNFERLKKQGLHYLVSKTLIVIRVHSGLIICGWVPKFCFRFTGKFSVGEKPLNDMCVGAGLREGRRRLHSPHTAALYNKCFEPMPRVCEHME